MVYTDKRGEVHALKNLPFDAKEVLISISEKHTFRGLHQSPYAKYIYIVDGHISDIYINFETNEFQHNELKKGDCLYIPENNAHAFYSYTKSTIIYFMQDRYNASLDKRIYWQTPEIPLELNNIYQRFENMIISKDDDDAKYYSTYKYLILGANGYLGSHLTKYLNNYLAINNRLSDIDGIKKYIQKSGCNYVICAAGISGRPTIEWCENNKQETIETNYIDMLNLMRLCNDCDVHLTILGSGLVYSNNKPLYTEDDIPDLTNKVYTRYRVQLEKLIREQLYNNVLYLRILYPCTFDNHPKCFYTKMLTRAKDADVDDVSVPLTIVPDLFPKIKDILQENATGILNFVNKGKISLRTFVGYDDNKVSNDSINKDKGYIIPEYELCSNKLASFTGKINTVEEAIKECKNN